MTGALHFRQMHRKEWEMANKIVTSAMFDEVMVKHYGVKGMRWGVRRDHNKNVTKKTYYRVSDKRELIKKKPMYVTGSANDLTGYKNMIKELKGTNEFRILEFNGDLKIASSKEAKKIFEDLKKNPKFKTFLDSPYVDDTKKEWNRNKYSDYNSSLADRNRKHKIFYDAVRKSGFDGLVDYNDASMMEDPLIIINTNKLHRRWNAPVIDRG